MSGSWGGMSLKERAVRAPAMRQEAPAGGRHRRRGLAGKLYLGLTVRRRARRILGATAVVGCAVAVALAAALGSPGPGNDGIPNYQKQDNPYLRSPAPQPADNPARKGPPTAGGDRSGAGPVPIPFLLPALNPGRVPTVQGPAPLPPPAGAANPASGVSSPVASPSATTPGPSLSPIPTSSPTVSTSPTATATATATPSPPAPSTSPDPSTSASPAEPATSPPPATVSGGVS